ncbi:Zn-ribbon domain-containing OB-fold protein [Halovenus salina]|uniref:Zn-ribbon domain-containing OB-fold protein n=1 Tax=Halovenus salina TaxID=1510225 RepID=UPI002260A005|nr:OB-fold domain-containing protein [Halovenus salina]
MRDDARDDGYDDFLDAVEEGEPYYLESPSGNGWLPPRAVDPETGETELQEEDLPERGEVLTHTTTHVSGPSFADDAPYIVAVASFGPVNITGQMRETEAVEIGQNVTLDVERTETTGDRVIVFRPVE